MMFPNLRLALHLIVMLAAWTLLPGSVSAGTTTPTDPAGAGAQLAARTLLALGQTSPRIGADTRVAVIYPELGEPYRSVFRQIVDGIERGAALDVVRISLDKSMTPKDLEAQLDARKAGLIIALGRHGLHLAAQLPAKRPVVGGAVLASPTDRPHGGALVSLAPDPRRLVEQLRRLAPSVERVHVVYSSAQSQWLVDLASPAAKQAGIELMPVQTEDLRSALKAFHEIMASARVGRDAIWLPQDSHVLDEQVVLPFVLQKAWDRSILVFSSTLGHVRRGALFALYPDNERMGEQLATSANALLEPQKVRPEIEPVSELKLALNTRTASHLGLNVEAIEDDIALRFPAR